MVVALNFAQSLKRLEGQAARHFAFERLNAISSLMLALTNRYTELPTWLDTAHRKRDAVVFDGYS